MIINHNISSLNTFNKLNKNNKKSATAMEKLASGLRINKASDDSAGLAISEKMRAQIRGLQQAERNIQDGISLIQTAEGGLSNIQDPNLLRLRELAIQSANDTLTSEDRQYIQKEVEQIKSGINEIANNTEFNGINLLNGNVDGTINNFSWTTGQFGSGGNVIWDGNKYITMKSVGGAPDVKVLSSTDGVSWNEIANIPGGYIYNLNFNEDNGQYVGVGVDSNTGEGFIVTSNDGQNWSTQTSNSLFGIDKIVWNGNKYVAISSASGPQDGSILSSTDGINWNIEIAHTNKRNLDIIWDNNQFVVSAYDGQFFTSSDGDNWNLNTTSSVQEFNAVVYGGNKYVAVGADIMYSNDGVNWNELNVPNNWYKDVMWDGNQFIAIGNDAIANSSDGVSWNIQTSTGYDLNKIIKVNNEFIAVGANGTVIKSNDGVNWEEEDVNTNIDYENIFYNINNNQLLLSGTENYIGYITSSGTNDTKHLNLQIGANSGESFSIELTDARTTSLGIDNIDLSTRQGAESAISKIDKALEKVSSERGKFGSYQNALEHIHNNVSNYEVNLTSAESRIRDADIAKEMMELTKNQILSQASQAMLTQGIQQPQQVLQLLK